MLTPWLRSSRTGERLMSCFGPAAESAGDSSIVDAGGTAMTELSVTIPPSLVNDIAQAAADRVVLALRNEGAVADVGRWLNAEQAAGYLGLTRNALHKLTAAR